MGSPIDSPIVLAEEDFGWDATLENNRFDGVECVDVAIVVAVVALIERLPCEDMELDAKVVDIPTTVVRRVVVVCIIVATILIFRNLMAYILLLKEKDKGCRIQIF